MQGHADRVERGEELLREVQAGGRRGGRALRGAVHRLVALGICERLVDVRRQRHLAVGLALDLDEPAPVTPGLAQPHRSHDLAGAKAPRRTHERLPGSVVVHALDEEHLDRAARRSPKVQARGHDTRVVHHDELAAEHIRKLCDRSMLDRAGRAAIDEEPRRVPRLDRCLRDQLVREVVLEERGVHPALRVASRPWTPSRSNGPSRGSRRRQPGRPEPAAIEAALERSRAQIEALAVTAAELEVSIPEHVSAAVRDGVRAEVLPVARHIAEIRGLLNQAIRRLERVEGDLLAERHARVDDLALLVDLVSSGWRGVDERLERLEERASRRRGSWPVEPLGHADVPERELEHAAAA